MCVELANVCGQLVTLLQAYASCPFHLVGVEDLGIKQ